MSGQSGRQTIAPLSSCRTPSPAKAPSRPPASISRPPHCALPKTNGDDTAKPAAFPKATPIPPQEPSGEPQRHTFRRAASASGNHGFGSFDDGHRTNGQTGQTYRLVRPSVFGQWQRTCPDNVRSVVRTMSEPQATTQKSSPSPRPSAPTIELAQFDLGMSYPITRKNSRIYTVLRGLVARWLQPS